MIVELKELKKVLNYLKDINSLDLKDIKWSKNGVEIKLTPEQIEEYNFIGLSNSHTAELFLMKE